MNKRKITKESLTELAKRMPVLSEEVQRSYVGGGDGTFGNPYSYSEYQQLNCPKSACYFNESGEICYDLPEVVITPGSGGGNSVGESGATDSSGTYGGFVYNSSLQDPFQGIRSYDYFWTWFFSSMAPNESGCESGCCYEDESGSENNPFWNWGVLGLNTAGDWGQNAEYILDDRGKYMSPGQIYKLNRPITVRLAIGNVETTSQVLNVVRVGGKYFGIVGNLFTGYDIINDYTSGNEERAYWKAGFAAAEAGFAFIPGWGWAVSLGLGIAEQFIFD